jgi:hypothetical protein
MQNEERRRQVVTRQFCFFTLHSAFLMTFLPIVQRELIEASRRRGTYRMRLGVAAAGLFIGGWIMLIPFLRTPAELGMTLFVALTVTASFYSLLIGIFRTADCLSEEKREGTLGLLFLTDLKGYDIVLGKLVATSLNAFYGLLALFPVMAIPLLVGGVTVAEFWRIVLVTVNNIFFSLAVGMFCSSICRDERKAMVLAFSIIFLLTAGFPFLAALFHDSPITRRLGWDVYCLIPSPGYAAFMAFEDTARMAGQHNHFMTSVILLHVLSWAALCASSLIVPRTWQEKTANLANARLNRIEFGAPHERRWRRRRGLEINPFYWLLTRNRMKTAWVWVVLACGAFIWALGLTFDPRNWKDEGAYVWTALIAHTLFKIWVVTEACRRFSADRQSGALELLLSTPLAVRSIVRGQTMALERQFAPPIGVVLIADVIFLANRRQDAFWVSFWIALMVIFVIDAVTLSWVGMWRGLNSRHPNRAAAVAILQIMVLPWLVFGLALTFLGISGSFRHSFWRDTGPEVLVLLGLGIFLALDAAFGLSARQRLLNEFRTVATTRFEARQMGGG